MKTTSYIIYSRFNLLFTVLMPAFSMLLGQTTLFYMIYLYWWQELIASMLDAFFLPTGRLQPMGNFARKGLGLRFFLLLVYFLFIVVVFGFMYNWRNDAILKNNLATFFFKDRVFTLNLFGILLNEWWGRRNKIFSQRDIQDPFSGRMKVMHIAILLGAAMQFMIIRKFPEIFTPGNRWGAVVVSFPFLLLKAYLDGRHELKAQIIKS